jgi:membrane-bound lytic murein transglycosylase D
MDLVLKKHSFHWRRAACLAGCIPLLVSFAGCSSARKPRVKISYEDAPPPAAPAPQPVQAAAAPAPAPPPAPEILPAAQETRPSTREAMEKALQWATEGLHAYQKGQWDTAHHNLDDARLLLLEADLPDFSKQQGLSVLQPGLPQDLRSYDIEAVFRELTAKDKPDAAELAERNDIERELMRVLRQFGDTTPNDPYLPVLVQETQSYISFYRGKYRDWFERAYRRKHKYWPVIREVFAQQKLPIELGYIAFVESGFNPRARSHADAHGLWQFIPETGRRYGLTTADDLYDTRRSTVAAADYLLDLLSIFGSQSFLLATASYNAGEGRIMGCLRHLDDPFKKRSFWEIRGCLAPETQEYIPKIMAAVVIGGDPKRYGFDLPAEDEVRKIYDLVTIPVVAPVARLAELSGVSLADLRMANTDMDSTATYTPGRNYPLFLPAGGGERLTAALAAAPLVEGYVASRELPGDEAQQRAPARHYVVKRGDNLAAIARRHGVAVEKLASWNGLRKPYRIHPGQRLAVSRGGGSSSQTARESREASSGTSGTSARTITYTVRRGNTLQAIADLFSVRYRDLMHWNNLHSSSLKAGQKLKIKPSQQLVTRSYKVRRGDNLAAIARRFGVSQGDILVANGLASAAALKPGQTIVVYAPA